MSNLNLTKASLLVSTLCLGLMGNVLAAQSVDKQLSVSSDTQLQIKVQRGDVTIQTWDKSEVSVTGTLDELSEGFVFEQQGNSLNIEDKMPRHYNGNNDNGSQLTIKVPKTVKLSADTISANLQVAETQGELDLNTVSGNINANNLSGKPELHTVSGDITTKALDGKIKLETVSGTIQDTDSKGEMNYRLVSGDLKSHTQAEKVTIEQVSGEVNANFSVTKEIELRTVSGDSQVSLAKNFNKANFESVSGDITVIFNDVPDASFNLDGGPGGKINNGLTQDVPQKQKYVPSTELSFQTGSGAANVKMNTISGHLILKKQ